MGNIKYVRPQDLKELLAIKEEFKGRAMVIAGGTNLIPNMRGGALSPELLIDVIGLEELSRIGEENGRISVGAMTLISTVASSDIIKRKSPILASAARQLGNPLTRNRATLGGNLADASPAADTAPPLLALEATVHSARPGGRGREIPLDQFFLGPRQTVLEDDEIITRITFPKPKDPSTGSHIKFGLRNAMAISVASIA
ncbi:MAG: FAD binding domain-containing protein, partial [Pseudomonadota bacterium]